MRSRSIPRFFKKDYNFDIVKLIKQLFRYLAFFLLLPLLIKEREDTSGNKILYKETVANIKIILIFHIFSNLKPGD